MRRRLRLVCGIAALAGALAAWQPAVAGTPPAAAWWSRANGLLPGVSLPPPPDVREGDLYVAGDGGDESTWQAVAALDVIVPAGSAVDGLTLRFAASPAGSGGSVLALCPLLAPFVPVTNGAWTDVPAHDCSSAIEGVAGDAGETVRFEGLGALVVDGHLRVLVVPVGTQRAIVVAPGSDSVTFTAAGEPAASAVPSTAAVSPVSGAVNLPTMAPRVIASTTSVPAPRSDAATAGTAPATIVDRPLAGHRAAGRDWFVGILGLGGLVTIVSDMAEGRRRAGERPRGVGHLRSSREGAPTPL